MLGDDGVLRGASGWPNWIGSSDARSNGRPLTVFKADLVSCTIARSRAVLALTRLRALQAQRALNSTRH
ncbi:hypothetical protein KQH60_09355 [Mycetohabitans sp. B8]|uniref:hypothetical protein n=1 Tax=Mycetohabitans sp. B8 TaxID=2841845 RepID=UPI001F302A48|nr:hypothetical protein [Mycetohabitans sp. B8]MCG1042733.1 hypothetical protein [Mycetohabitans sp. B8]